MSLNQNFPHNTKTNNSGKRTKKITHNLRHPEKAVDIIPTLHATHSLLSTSKFANANYIAMLMPTAVQIYDGETTNITASQTPVLTGWHNNLSGLWHALLTQKPQTQGTSKQHV